MEEKVIGSCKVSKSVIGANGGRKNDGKSIVFKNHLKIYSQAVRVE
jgi:hypothetical protein